MGAGISFQNVKTRIQRGDPSHICIAFRTHTKMSRIARIYRCDGQYHQHVGRSELRIDHCVVAGRQVRTCGMTITTNNANGGASCSR